MSSSNSIGEFSLDKINLRKALCFKDGTIQTTAPIIHSLSQVLTVGNSAGSNDLDMNNQNINDVDTVQASTVVAPNISNSGLLYFSPFNTNYPFSYWTYDIGFANPSYSYNNALQLYCSAFYLPEGFVLNNIFYGIGSTATATSMAGLYTGSGTMVASSSVITSTSNRVNRYPITTPYTIPTSGIYYTIFINTASTNLLAFSSNANFLNYPNLSTQTGTLTGFRTATATAQPSVNLPSTLAGIVFTPVGGHIWVAVS